MQWLRERYKFAWFVTSVGLEKSDDFGEVTNYANRWKLSRKLAYIL